MNLFLQQLKDTVLFTCYYTEGTPYAMEVERLRGSLTTFGLESVIRSRLSKSNWKLNTYQKIDHLIEMANSFPDKCIVWLDADAEVVKSPLLFGGLAIQNIDFSAAKARRGVGVLGGTMFFGRNPRRVEFLTEVRGRLLRSPNAFTGEQDCVSIVNIEWMGNKTTSWVYAPLPIQYCAVYYWGITNPIVLHHQASKRFRKQIDSQELR